MIRLAVFDLDGTLTRGPTVCQVLADPVGRRLRVEQLCACLDRVTLAARRIVG